MDCVGHRQHARRPAVVGQPKAPAREIPPAGPEPTRERSLRLSAPFHPQRKEQRCRSPSVAQTWCRAWTASRSPSSPGAPTGEASRASGRSIGSLYPGYDPLPALAAAAAVTERIRLTTAIMIAPYRQKRNGARQGGRHTGQPLRRAADPRHRRRLTRGRLRGRRRSLQGPRQGVRAPARADEEGLGRGGSRHRAGRTAASSAGRAGADHRRRRGRGLRARRQVRRGLDRGRRTAGGLRGGQGEDGGGLGARTAARASRGAWRSATSRWAPTPPPTSSAPSSTTTGSSGRTRTRSRPASPATRTWPVRYVEAFTSVGCDELIMFPASKDPDQVDLLADAVLPVRV